MHRQSIKLLLLVCACAFWSRLPARGQEAADPLQSWNDGPAKAAILTFVKSTTTEGSQAFVPPADRIAVFDNDGTLWPENPLPFEIAFALDVARNQIELQPELRQRPAYQALAEGNIAALKDQHFKLLLELVVATHAGQTTEAFEKTVSDWIGSARHPRFGRLYADCTYLPMQEVLAHFRQNGYRTYLVSGGGQTFMRVWSEQIYGVPREQVIGSVFKTRYELIQDKPTLTILPEIALIDDKAGKPVAIHHVIGKTPIACFGNSDGDHEMLQQTTIGHSPSLGVIIHHTDAEREYAYDAQPRSSGKLIEALAAAPRRGWLVVDMKRDWKTVFAEPKPAPRERQ